MKSRAAAIILEDRKIVVIQRIKGTQDYWVLPGGSIEKEETPEAACKREIKEEVGLDIEVLNLVSKVENRGRKEFYFLAKRRTGRLKLGEPEYSRSTEFNRYIPTWVDIERLEKLNIQPKLLKPILARLFGSSRTPALKRSTR